ncbi:L-threonylcarbamoyladenylate synthase [Novosphingobium sp. 1949]|uniref:Threonylcarbamoyl-AMP synthase n=1 Tax=Novosphingobium organovorum TaxID=2930092 RepID=A0ABT0BAW1_9SPHN|nr:L-threonylcarbamoyladenylate synthase [Novosphingobium organovorum]MCJ2182192.1 L-threonylcarbamoyladenylate synthase [Novosphingobium organovorum]
MPTASRPRLLAADPAAIFDAAEILRAGGLVAIPTETVYGLAARADRDESVAAIYAAKGRPSFNPLIVHVADRAGAEAIAQLDARAVALAEAFWPGPLTLVLPLREGAPIAAAVTAGLPTVALRCPAHPVMRAVIAATGIPLAAPSANRSGAVSPTEAAHVVASLGDRIDAVIDGGPCAAGLESTIVALRADGTWQILRPGPIPTDDLAQVLGSAPAVVTDQAIEAPGQLASHYAPGKPVRLGALEAEADEFHIGFGIIAGHASLSPGGDLNEAASRLYALLHQGAADSHPRIAIAPVPEAGIGAAINDRLRRAAA